MKKYVIALSLLLSACTASPAGTGDISLKELLKNPLFAEQYYDLQVEHLVSMIVQKDTITEDARAMRIIEEYRIESQKKDDEAVARQREGRLGVIGSDYSYTDGNALLLNNTIYFGPDFVVAPGPNLHVYAFTGTDPRFDDTFPEQAVDLGQLKSPFGTQSYVLPPLTGSGRYASMALYDRLLDRVYGFAQF